MEKENQMPGMTLEVVARACEGTYVGTDADRTRIITGVVRDNRDVEEGNLFVAIEGERVDGHRFVGDAFARGACAALVQKEPQEKEQPYILVNSTTEAMKKLAAWYRRSLDIRVVGITGSVGKTSTKEMIASVLAQKYSVLKTDGNYNNEIGLPLTIFRIRGEHQVAVLEMGISDFGEMHRLSEMAHPDICVITNIGLCHLENLGTREGILNAKTECFEHMAENGTVILNGDDDMLCTKKEVNGKPVLYYGIDHEAKLSSEGRSMAAKSVYATDIVNLGFEGMELSVHTPAGVFDALIPIPGEHNVYNALAATAVGLELGLSLGEIRQGIASVKTIAGRTNVLDINGMKVIDDCYNANPVSMKASLEVLSHAKGRSIAVLGDMGELGEDERKLHREVGVRAGQLGISTVFAAGTLAEEYVKGIRETGSDCEIHYYADRDSMTAALLEFVEPGDYILVKASHFMEFPKVIEAMKEKRKMVKNPIVTITMENGDVMKAELYPEIAPNTVNNFISLIQKNFYDGVIFHRVIRGFMLQGGDPEGTGTGGPGYSIKGEFSQNGFKNDLLHEPGVLSMARTMIPDSAGSQFFIMHKRAPHLDGAYAAFGRITEGMDVVNRIAETATDYSDRPLEEQKIAKITVDTFGEEYPEPETIPE